jgi:hypothetical protein
LFNPAEDVNLCPSPLWQFAHESEQLFCSCARRALRRRRSQFRDYFLAHGDLNLGAGVFADAADQL